MQQLRFSFLIILISVLTLFTKPMPLSAKTLDTGKKVLVVMSYHQGYSGEELLRQGIESVLTSAELRYFYMDTKQNLKQGKKKAKEAFALYNQFKPDAVIAANDNAQALFVVPYLKNRVKTPVIFCGVNNSAEKYAYPCQNVTGILEKKHYREGISFAQLLDPKLKTVGVIYKDNPSNRSNLAQINQEKESYTAEITEAIEVKTLAEAKQTVHALGNRTDAILFLNLTGLADAQGRPMEGKKVLVKLLDGYGKTTIGADLWELKAGLLCGVIQSDVEQGSLASYMLLRHWQGTSLQNIPLDQNRNGQRHINIATLKKIGLKLPPEAALGTEIILPEIEL